MTEIIGVRFKPGGKLYYFNPNGVHVNVGQHVIIETSKGIEFAQCSQSNTMVDEMELVATLRPMLRIATEEDFRTVEQNHRKEKDAYQICQKKIAEHGLDMKLVEVKYSFDGSKVLFYFTSDGRVDFRALVKDLASVFRTRIELRQIGVRDEAKMMGGLGICGRSYCCSQFLADFQPVSIKMAKTQNLSLNPTKISGACGRLMCCLKYEQDTYEALLKATPKLDSLVKTPDGVGTINAVQLLTEQVRVTLDNDPGSQHTYHKSEVEVIRSGKGKRPVGYELPEEGDAAQKRPASARSGAASAPKGEGTFSAGGKAAYASSGQNGKAEQGSAAHRPSRGAEAPEEGAASQPPKKQSNGEKTQNKANPPKRKRPQNPQPRPAAPAPSGEEGAVPAEGQQAARRHRTRRHHPKGNGTAAGPSGAPGGES